MTEIFDDLTYVSIADAVAGSNLSNGAIHILDYKPDASTNKPFAQLTIYALALSQLTGISLFDFKCWPAPGLVDTRLS